MWNYPNFNPVALDLGVIIIHWYAISYLVGIGLVWWTVIIRNKVYGYGWTSESISDLVTYAVFGVILGGRIGYILFYDFTKFISEPVIIVKIWQGGMSFHGGLLGVMLASLVYVKRTGKNFMATMDLIAPSVPLALGCGRIGNFVNGELPGRITEVPWGVIFPGEILARHPSSLYQAFMEGVVLFAVMWLYASVRRPHMAISGLFLLSYGIIRCFTEIFRQPDSHIGFLMLERLTMGQLLSLPMALIGLMILIISYRNVS